MKPLTTLVFSIMQSTKSMVKLVCHLFVYSLLSAEVAYAASGTWLSNPVDNNWGNPANWSSQTVPGPSDTATFGISSITDIEVPPAGGGAADVFFDPNADAYTFTVMPGGVFGVNDALINNSGVAQNFVALADESSSGSLSFNDATITGPVTFTQHPFNAGDAFTPSVVFLMSDAGVATFHNLGASASGGVGGRTDFWYTASSAEQSTIVNDGGTAPGAGGGATAFVLGAPTAAAATLIANGGSNGGGSFTFFNGSTGGTARVKLFGNGYLDLSSHQPASLRIGSLEGNGIVYLGSGALIVGSSSLSTTFSGLLQPGTPSGGSGTGALEKIGTGTLTLTGASVYTAGTTVSAGTLVVSNTSGSATGTGAVFVNAGTLGGSGIISGAVTIGTGSGNGAFLAPAHGGNKQLTLTIQSSLTFNSESTYTYTFKAARRRGP